jgi:hypothetical protein
VTDRNDEAVDARSVLQRLLGPEASELSCEACFELLDQYVELELAGVPAEEAVPGMLAHLEGCAACHEEHESLLALVREAR